MFVCFRCACNCFIMKSYLSLHVIVLLHVSLNLYAPFIFILRSLDSANVKNNKIHR